MQNDDAGQWGNKVTLGIYEKALPASLEWPQRLDSVRDLGFAFLELSIDEQPERQRRLDWDRRQRLAFTQARLDSGVAVPSMCLSAHRRFPFGSRDAILRQRAFQLMEKALALAVDLGIRNIQLAGYDVYYEPSDRHTRDRFLAGLRWAVEQAAKAQVMLSIEIMDTTFINSISKWLEFDDIIRNPWFTVYPDLGNLTAWGNNVAAELTKGIGKITAIHLKDTSPVTPDSPGKFRDVAFGDGCVDFVEAFRTLRQLNYRGPYLLEMWSRDKEDDIERVRQAKTWMEQRMRLGGLFVE
ncbi:L-ribulose-5-phosphate 3-epimerase [Martelella alba]|uniref:L-ribulose-5-phosphate 3-epimerase n=1 Tax=Martelella alba TaxID=2590451 RepID=A0ABY2SHY4_9HYPH|nr:L-ribulose-5-phosphate 3-epimerase [Martelella alba]TKI04978.1 L-ribulose-5-phosphate 3-epimerase [Martelella alba]